MSLFFLRIVHCSVVPRYHIAENFREFHGFIAIRERFSPRNLGHGVLCHCKSEQSAKVFSVIVLSPIRESFLPWKFSGIRYVVKFNGRVCRWHLEIYHSCSNCGMAKIIVHLPIIRMNNGLIANSFISKSRWTALLLTRPWKTQAHDHTFSLAYHCPSCTVYLVNESSWQYLRMNSLSL